MESFQDNNQGNKSNTNFNLKNINEDYIDFKEILNSIIRKRKWVISSGLLIFLSTQIYTFHQRIFNPLFLGGFSLLIKDAMETDKTLDKNSTNYYQSISTNVVKYDLETLERYLKSPKFVKELAIKYKLKPSFLSESINISRSNINAYLKSKGVLDISLFSKNKITGKLILDDLSNLYLNESLIRKQQKIKDGLNFLKNQSPKIEQKADLLQSKLVIFREKNNLIDPKVEGVKIKKTQEDIDNQILNFKTDINRLKNVRKEIINGSLTARGFKEELGNGLSISDFDQGLLSQLLSVEEEIAIAKSKFTSNSSIIKGLESRLKQIQPVLLKNQLEAVDIALNLNKQRIKNLINLKKENEADFQKLPILIKDYQKIEQDLSLANQNLVDLNSSIASFELELAQSKIPWSILSEPYMLPNPESPSVSRNLRFGFFIALFFSLIIGIIRDKFDNVYHSPDEITSNLKTPLLGTLPFIENFENLREEKQSIFSALEKNTESSSEKNKNTYSKFAYTEALRNIYTSIKFLRTENKLKIILITSSIPKEGKSLFNILLAKTISEIGEKVLLIDADMRKPSLHQKLEMDNILGLSNYLSDETLDSKKIIQNLNNYENISIITAGQIPPDPVRLLNSNRFIEFIKELKESSDIDLILFDTPPILGLADTKTIGNLVDGTFLLLSLNYTKRMLPKESLKNLKACNNFCGIIGNAVKKDPNSEILKYNNNYKYDNYSYTYSSYLNDEIENETDNVGQEEENYFLNKINKFPISKLLYKYVLLVNKNIKKFTNWLDN